MSQLSYPIQAEKAVLYRTHALPIMTPCVMPLMVDIVLFKAKRHERIYPGRAASREPTCAGGYGAQDY
jgi:hypothetical protein